MFRIFSRVLLIAVAAALLVEGGCRRHLPTPQQVVAPATPSAPVYPDNLRGEEPTIRVRCLVGGDNLTLIVNGAYALNVITLNGDAVSGGGEKPATIGITPVVGGVKVGKDLYREITVTPLTASPLKLRYLEGGKAIDREFPGAFTFKLDASGRLQAIAALPIESYLTGVIAGEMPLDWHPEALKAQTLASRTYALYESKTRHNADYDVERDTRSQVWNPRNTDVRARLAAQATRGEILTINQQIFPTYFHSQCGGETADGKYVFAGAAATPLRGGVKCLQTKPRIWEKTFSRNEISQKLAAKKISGGNLLRVELLDQNQQLLGSAPARAYFIRLFYENGVERVMPFNSFRLAIGAERGQIDSSFLVATHIEQHLKFSGLGAGHGVGMCQYGAAAAAEQHRNYRQIAQYYYPGAAIVKAW